MHFGLEGIAPLVLYSSAVFAVLASIFWRPEIGVLYLIALIPLQTIRWRFQGMPLGESIVGVLLVSVALGLFRQRRSIFGTPWDKQLIFYCVFTFGSLWYGSMTQGLPLPLPGDTRFGDWLDYMFMPLTLLLVAATLDDPRKIKIALVVMCLSICALDKGQWSAVSSQDFSSFSNDLREEPGSMGYAGVNGLAAFQAQAAVFLLAMSGFGASWRRWAFLAISAITTIGLMYTLSRGGYLALLAGWFFLGIVHQRKLLLVVALFALTWSSIVPPAVYQRVTMTYDNGELDHSSETRMNLWEDAMQVFDSNAALGSGFDTYAYMGRVGDYRDTHNIYVKVLCETGAVGLAIFLWLLAKPIRLGFRLFRQAQDPFFAGLGLGLAAWVVTAAVANFFGDRWTFLQVNGYQWVLAGLVASAIAIERTAADQQESAPAPALELMGAV